MTEMVKKLMVRVNSEQNEFFDEGCRIQLINKFILEVFNNECDKALAQFQSWQYWRYVEE